MIYTIDPQIFEMFPLYCRGVVVARNIDNTKLNPEMASQLCKGSERVASDPSISVESHPRLTVWSNAYRRFGANPVKETPSICFLVKHVKSGKLIRSISPVVDVFNLFSLKLLIPCGGDDLDAVGGGDLKLGVAEGDEQFSPLFKPQATENPQSGEVIYFTSTASSMKLTTVFSPVSASFGKRVQVNQRSSDVISSKRDPWITLRTRTILPETRNIVRYSP